MLAAAALKQLSAGTRRQPATVSDFFAAAAREPTCTWRIEVLQRQPLLRVPARGVGLDLGVPRIVRDDHDFAATPRELTSSSVDRIRRVLAGTPAGVHDDGGPRRHRCAQTPRDCRRGSEAIVRWVGERPSAGYVLEVEARHRQHAREASRAAAPHPSPN